MIDRHYKLLVSALFSILVIYYSVGIPIIRSGCSDCSTELESNIPAIVVNLQHDNIGNGCEKAGECCCCCCHSDGKTDGMNCSDVRIEKMSQIEPLSYSVSTISLIPEIDLLYYSYSFNIKELVASTCGCNDVSCTLKPPPDVYLNLLCSLLI